jgi:alanyl-tRNA synthetase
MFVHLSKLSKDDAPHLKPDALKHSLTLLIDTVITKYQNVYSEVSSRREVVIQSMSDELLQFQETVKKGEKRLTEMFGTGKMLSGKDAFLLYDTYGFPIELTKELAADRGIDVDMDGFTTEMTKAQERSRQ